MTPNFWNINPRGYMITHKSKFAPFMVTCKVTFKKSNWYLFPQGWAWCGGYAEVSYVRPAGEYDVWNETHYDCYKGYAFSWLFLQLTFDLRKRNNGNNMLVEKRELRMPDLSKEAANLN